MNKTLEVFLKLFAYICIGAGTSLGSSLAQWANSSEWPGKIQWIVIIVAACVAGSTQLLSFMSGTWKDYQATNGKPAEIKP